MLGRRILVPATVAAAIAAGGVAGAVLGVPGISGAQESPTTVAPGPEDAPAPPEGARVRSDRGRGRQRSDLGGNGLDPRGYVDGGRRQASGQLGRVIQEGELLGVLRLACDFALDDSACVVAGDVVEDAREPPRVRGCVWGGLRGRRGNEEQ